MIQNFITTVITLFLGVQLAHAKDFVVTNTTDAGSGSLRQAITDANTHPGPDKIIFNIPMTDSGFLPAEVTGEQGEAFFIRLDSALPAITEALIIDGNSQTRFTGDTNEAVPGGDSGAEVIIFFQPWEVPLKPGSPEGVQLESFKQLDQATIMASNNTMILSATLMVQEVSLRPAAGTADYKNISEATGGKSPMR